MALNDVPLTGQSLDQTRNPIRNNFTAIDAGFERDHITFDLALGADQGKHKKITMPRQSPVPSAPSGTEGLLYAALGPESATTELYWRRNSASSVRSLTEASLNNPGWSMLPSGLLIKWATVANNSGTGVTAHNVNNLPFVGPNMAAVLSAYITIFDSGNTDPDTVAMIEGLGGATVNIKSFRRTVAGTIRNSSTVLLVLGTRV